MITYPIPMIPGPVSVPERVRRAYLTDFGSGDLEREFLDLYNSTEAGLQQWMGTRHSVAILSGEGMLALWSALKSTLVRGDRVLAVGTGVFGYGIGDMARAIGAQVRTVALPYDQTIGDLTEIEQAIRDFRPKMITAVHCETPSGTLNPLEGLGKLKEKYGVPLFYVDAVASVGGAPVRVDDWHIDLGLGGSQKALSVPPGMCFVSVSPAAWEIIERVDYPGYDALKPFRHAQRDFYFPYTPYWHGMAALKAGVDLLLEEGLEASFSRHEAAARAVREGVQALGLTLFPAEGAVSSPTVTAIKVPEALGWPELDARLRARGLAAGGSYGPLAGKVFRLGHMGTQADLTLVRRALDALADATRDVR